MIIFTQEKFAFLRKEEESSDVELRNLMDQLFLSIIVSKITARSFALNLIVLLSTI